MCGRFVITSPPEALRQIFGYDEQPNFPPRHNIAPTQPIPVVILDQGRRHFRLMRWGLVPGWVKDPRNFTLLINARAETVREKPAFKNAVRRRRVLVPADGYYEWQDNAGKKRPFFIHRRDGAPLGFAGLAETWAGPNGEEVDTIALLTTAASPDLASLHHRMPVTIPPADFERWLDCSSDDAAEIMNLLGSPEEGIFVWHEVSRRVNAVANDDAQLVLAISDAERAAEEASILAKRAAKPAASRKPPPTDDGQGSLF
jgi:putative SOS response-associated peptidase YedK